MYKIDKGAVQVGLCRECDTRVVALHREGALRQLAEHEATYHPDECSARRALRKYRQICR